MGNTVSVPPREPFVNQEASYNTILRNVNQSRLVGNPDPVTQNSDPNTKAILKAASPLGFNLTQTTMADRSIMKTKAEECRKYQGMAGIRDLDLKIGTRTAYEPGCGWMYKKNGISRGAFGSEGDAASPNNPRAPIFSRAGEQDEVTDNSLFYMDLAKIERLASKDMVNDIATCQGMAAKVGIADIAPYIGYCKTSGRVIPVQRKPTGGAVARLADDVEYRCASNEIILPENTASCPAPGSVKQTSRLLGSNGFKNYEGVGSGSGSGSGSVSGSVSGSASKTSGRSIDKAFHQPTWALNNQHATMAQQFSRHGGSGAQRQREGFVSSYTNSETDRCREIGNLGNNDASKKCIIFAALEAGFGNNGSFLKFMSAGITSTQPPVFENYRRLVDNTDFIISKFTDNTNNLSNIINILTSVRLNISSSNYEISKAARDIVSDAGVYEADYNLCSWIEKPEVDINLITAGDRVTEKCLQNFWRNKGGDSRGVDFPTLAKWVGSTIGQFKQAFELIANDINSTDMDKQSQAIKKMYGVNTYKENVTIKYIQKPRNCERELVSSTQSSCPTTLKNGQSIPNYTSTYKVKPGGDAVAGGTPCVLQETKACTPTMCDPVNCVGEWRETSCSTTCGAGTKTKTYVVTTPAQCGGTQCAIANGTAGSTTPCNARECSADDCKYTRTVVTDCPANLGSATNCGRTHTRLVNLVPQQNYGSDISRLCPTTPSIESCGAAVACAPPPPVMRGASTTGCLSLVTDGEIQSYGGGTQIVVLDNNYVAPPGATMPRNYGQQSHTQYNSQYVGGGFGSGGAPTNLTGPGVPIGTKITSYRMGTSNNQSNQNAIFINLDRAVGGGSFCYS